MEDRELEITVGSAEGVHIEGVDVSVVAGGTRLEVELGVADDVDVGVVAGGITPGVEVGVADDVVEGSAGVDVLVVEGTTAAGGVLRSFPASTPSELLETMTAEDVLDMTPLYSGSGSTPYTGTFSLHGSVGHTAVTRDEWVKRMHRMPKGN